MSDPILTSITGALYTPEGVKITDGNLVISLSNSFISVDGNRVSPFAKTVEIMGDFSFSLYATENTLGGSAYAAPIPTGIRYTLEFDPDPSNTSIAITRKNGYFRNSISVPHISDTPLSNSVHLHDLSPLEYLNINKYYGKINILDNDPRLLSMYERSLLLSGVSASSLHYHSELPNILTIARDNTLAAPPTDSVAIHLSDTFITSKTSTHVVFDDGTNVILFYS